MLHFVQMLPHPPSVLGPAGKGRTPPKHFFFFLIEGGVSGRGLRRERPSGGKGQDVRLPSEQLDERREDALAESTSPSSIL